MTGSHTGLASLKLAQPVACKRLWTLVHSVAAAGFETSFSTLVINTVTGTYFHMHTDIHTLRWHDKKLLALLRFDHQSINHSPHSLSVPRHNLSFGARAFRVAASKIWNSIPLHIHQSQTYSSFKRHLKTHYFISAHLAPVIRPDSLLRLWRYINLLLTYLDRPSLTSLLSQSQSEQFFHKS